MVRVALFAGKFGFIISLLLENQKRRGNIE